MFKYLDKTEAQLFLDKFLKISESEPQIIGAKAFEERNGIPSPPCPSGLDVGHLIYNLLSIPRCFEDEPGSGAF